MRHITACLLAAALLLSLTACGQETPKEPETLGQALLQEFETQYQSASKESLDTIAQAILAQKSIEFEGITAPIEPGPLMGFGNTQIQGFKEGVMFAPLISTIPFLGYLFRLDPDTDGKAFVQTLEQSANLGWNICTQADEMIVKQENDVVFFLMCPRSMEEPSQEELSPEEELPPEQLAPEEELPPEQLPSDSSSDF